MEEYTYATDTRISEFKKYQDWADSKWSSGKCEGKHADLIVASLGLSGEAGEFVDAVKKTVAYGKDLDVANLKEELGDILYYVAVSCSALDIDLTEIVASNKEKLNSRYPDGFSCKDAIAREDKR